MNAGIEHKILDGRKLATSMREKIAEDVIELAGTGFAPSLISITVGDTEASALYVRN